MSWKNYIKQFQTYLRLERSLSTHTIEAYVRDINKLLNYLDIEQISKDPKQITSNDVSSFIQWIAQTELAPLLKPEFYPVLRLFLQIPRFRRSHRE